MADLEICVFCKRREVASADFGEMLSRDGITIHQNCLYFSSGLAQTGDVSQGISGFRVPDIQAEMKRATSRKMVCSVCRQPGKYIGCGVSSCPKGGHFPCLVSADFLFQHYDAFRAFCPRHAPTQRPLSCHSECCCICLGSLSPPSLYCPSCKTVFHKTCIQTQASTAGRYFFRCPTCNSVEDFTGEMLRMGIAIPERDAKWETDNYFSADFDDLKVCQEANCLCPQGRDHVSRRFRMLKCQTCGQWMGHIQCLQGRPKECSVCASVPAKQTETNDPCTTQPNVSKSTNTAVPAMVNGSAPSKVTLKVKIRTPQIVLHRLTRQDLVRATRRRSRRLIAIASKNEPKASISHQPMNLGPVLPHPSPVDTHQPMNLGPVLPRPSPVDTHQPMDLGPVLPHPPPVDTHQPMNLGPVLPHPSPVDTHQPMDLGPVLPHPSPVDTHQPMDLGPVLPHPSPVDTHQPMDLGPVLPHPSPVDTHQPMDLGPVLPHPSPIDVAPHPYIVKVPLHKMYYPHHLMSAGLMCNSVSSWNGGQCQWMVKQDTNNEFRFCFSRIYS